MGRLPDFIVIGAMKSGTTSFAAYLDRHPDVAVSKPKEPNFFADPGNWDKGLDWYKGLFAQDAAIVGEASTFYTMIPEFTGAAKRICRTLPDAKLFYLVRDPIERMRSMFVHRADKHQAHSRSLTEAIEQQPGYLEISRYGSQLEPYLEGFARDQVLVLTTDELQHQPDVLLARAFRHLGVEPNVTIPISDRLNEGSEKKNLSGLGFSLAKGIRATRLRTVLPARTRRAVKHWFSDDFTEDVLKLDPETEQDLRRILAPDMVVIRDLVASTGAEIPGWLQPAQ